MIKLSRQDSRELQEAVPKIIQAFHDGVSGFGMTLKLHGLPAPQEENGAFTFDFGAFEIRVESGPAHEWLSGRIVKTRDHQILFPEAIPRIIPVVGGLSLKWGKHPRIVTSLLTRLVGATIEEVLLFDTHAEIRVGNGPDQEIDWTA